MFADMNTEASKVGAEKLAARSVKAKNVFFIFLDSD
jgi:hypothetical protein